MVPAKKCQTLGMLKSWTLLLLFSQQVVGAEQLRRHKRHWLVPTMMLQENFDYGEGEYIGKVIPSVCVGAFVGVYE